MGLLGLDVIATMSSDNLVLIEWIDVSKQVGIVGADNFNNTAILYTCGALVSKTAKFYNLALSSTEPRSQNEYGDIISIPKSLIIKVQVKPANSNKIPEINFSDYVIGCSIEFLDASKQEDSGAFREGIVCYAFGHLLHEDKTCISVCQDIDALNNIAREVYHIPKSCILNKKFVKFSK